MLNKKTVFKILAEIKKAKKILLTVHVSPDLDSLCSVLAMNLFLKKLRKEIKMISFSQIPERFQFVPDVADIVVADFARINLDEFDLAIVLDSAQERMITRSPYPKRFPSAFKVINIDHHITNTKFGDINLTITAASTTEILYRLFNFWQIKIGKDLARLIFYGIFADTGCFQYSSTSAETFRIAADLLENGDYLSEAVLHIFRSYNFKTLKYWGKILDNMKLDESKKFVWSKISRAEREELEIDVSEVEGAANFFAPVVEGIEFGIILIEESEFLVRGSLRSRNKFDVSKVAVALGGGGHKAAAGFSLNMSLDEAEKRVLETAREIIK